MIRHVVGSCRGGSASNIDVNLGCRPGGPGCVLYVASLSEPTGDGVLHMFLCDPSLGCIDDKAEPFKSSGESEFYQMTEFVCPSREY